MTFITKQKGHVSPLVKTLIIQFLNFGRSATISVSFVILNFFSLMLLVINIGFIFFRNTPLNSALSSLLEKIPYLPSGLEIRLNEVLLLKIWGTISLVLYLLGLVSSLITKKRSVISDRSKLIFYLGVPTVAYALTIFFLIPLIGKGDLLETSFVF